MTEGKAQNDSGASGKWQKRQAQNGGKHGMLEI